MQCKICGENLRAMSGEISTYLGYVSFVDEAGREHVHDNNERARYYTCARGHRCLLVKLTRCPVEECSYRGGYPYRTSVGIDVEMVEDWP